METTENPLRGDAVTVKVRCPCSTGAMAEPSGMPGPSSRADARGCNAPPIHRGSFERDSRSTESPSRGTRAESCQSGLWRSHRRFQNRLPHRRDRAIDVLGADAVVVMNEKPMRTVA